MARRCISFLLLALVAGLPGCAGTDAGSSGVPPRRAAPVLVEKELSPGELERLQELERLYVQGDASYPEARDRALAAQPKLGPWLAKALTFEAVTAFDDLQRREIAPDPEAFASDPHPFYRAARELAALGDPGREAVRHYLLRDRRGPVRRIGTLVLGAFSEETRLDLLEEELEHGNPASRRAALESLAGLRSDRAGVLLLRAMQDDDWQVRGTTLPSYAQWVRGRPEAKEAAALLWRHYETDSDDFVRRMALEALGELGDVMQVRPLVDALEREMERGNARTARTAADALRALTDRRFGTKVLAWRAWLGDL